MKADYAVTVMSRAEVELAEADTIAKVKKFKNVAYVAKIYHKRVKFTREAVDEARRYELLAERKMGQLLKEAKANGTRKGKGGDQKSDQRTGGVRWSPPNLKELGISRNEAARAQQLAEIHGTQFNRILEGRIGVTRAILDDRKKRGLYKPKPKKHVINVAAVNEKKQRRNKRGKRVAASAVKELEHIQSAYSEAPESDPELKPIFDAIKTYMKGHGS